VLLRISVALAVLGLLVVVLRLWRRPPRRLARADRLDLAVLGVRGPAIVQFTTPSCAPCRAAAPHLERAAREAEVAYAQVDVVERPEVARAFGIRTVPTIAVAAGDGRVHGVWTALPANGEIARAAREAARSRA
jgi:thiol-disulfide isomerase/thioredoxin